MENTNLIVYDLETQHTFAEVGGDHYDKLRISYAGVYSYSQDKFFGFFERDLAKLEVILQKEQPTIIGFNSIAFDNKVIEPYFRNLDISSLPQIDILAEIYSTLGFRMKLESVAQATLGTGKSGTGLDAIRYFREGNFEALAKYCLDDVRVTRDVYEYGKNHGFILYTAAGEVRRMPVSWASSTTLTDQLQQAFQAHQRVTIHYWEYLPDTITRVEHKTTIDIIAMLENTIQAYCHTKHITCDYLVTRILSIELQPATYAYQASLL